MADTSLDAFFAKRDKRSGKKPKSPLTPGDVPATADDDRQKRERRRRSRKKGEESAEEEEKRRTTPGGPGSLGTEAEDGQWNDFQPEKEADYTGLRIRQLAIKEEEADDHQSPDSGDGDDDDSGDGGAARGRGDTDSGPWKTLAPVQGAAVAAPDAAAAAPPSPPEAGKGVGKENRAPGKYVPPAQRRAAMMTAAAAKPVPAGSRSSNRKQKPEALDVGSHEEFPTLGRGGRPVSAAGGSAGGSVWGSAGGSVWGSAGGSVWGTAATGRDSVQCPRGPQPQGSRGPNLPLKNKFSALNEL